MEGRVNTGDTTETGASDRPFHMDLARQGRREGGSEGGREVGEAGREREGWREYDKERRNMTEQ